MTELTPQLRSMRARIGAYTRWAHEEDRSAATAPARKAADARFERQVDPDGVLAPAERAKRAETDRKLYFTQLAYKSAKARRRNSGGAA